MLAAWEEEHDVRAVAIHTYQEEEFGELSFVEGDVIVVTWQPEGEWWSGYLETDERKTNGDFPKNYVRKYLQVPEHVQASRDYHPPSDLAKTCISFVKGDVLLVLAKPERGWYWGRVEDQDSDSRVGMFPSDYAEPMSEQEETDWRIKRGNEAWEHEDALKQKVWYWWRKRSAPRRTDETPDGHEARITRLEEEKAAWGEEMKEAYGKLHVLTPEKRAEIALELRNTKAQRDRRVRRLERGDNLAAKAEQERKQRMEQQRAGV